MCYNLYGFEVNIHFDINLREFCLYRAFFYFPKKVLYMYIRVCYTIYVICGQKDKDICFRRLNMKTKKKSNRKAETVNIYLEIAKNVIEILAFAITIIKSLGN